MNFHSLSSKDFSQLEGVRQVISHDHSRKFILLDLGSEIGNYGLAWRSELIEPITKLSSNNSHIWIAVDQQVAAICLGTGQVCLKLSLFSNIVRLDFSDKIISVATESEIILINSDFSVKEIHSLPEVPSTISFINSQSQLEVEMIDGQILIMDV